MKNLLLVCGLSASLFSCSLLQRRGGPEDAGEPKAPATESGDDRPLFTPDGEENGGVSDSKNAPANNGESEVSKLTTKIAALETKVDVLSANLEHLQAEKSQPVIQAEPQPNLAAPVGESASEIQDQTRSTEVSAAPARPSQHLPAATKSTLLETDNESSKTANGAEREFRASMELFQNGQNLEAASHFAFTAKKFPHHLLAAHALYWAGEASSRAKQWAIAAENWEELEKKYPHSAYMPETLAGLAKVFEAEGDLGKAQTYRSLLARSFPKSSVAMKSGTESVESATLSNTARHVSHSSDSAKEAPLAASDDPAPVFEDDNSSNQKNGSSLESQ